jgi:hypothetical protein
VKSVPNFKGSEFFNNFLIDTKNFNEFGHGQLLKRTAVGIQIHTGLVQILNGQKRSGYCMIQILNGCHFKAPYLF